MSQAWAKRLIDLLVEVGHEVTAAGEPLRPGRIAHIRALYAEILTEGEAANWRTRTDQAKQSH
jgi:hypothetical protein